MISFHLFGYDALLEMVRFCFQPFRTKQAAYRRGECANKMSTIVSVYIRLHAVEYKP